MVEREESAVEGTRPQRPVLQAVDGPTFKGMVRAALLWLRRHHEQVNAMNVFPVPDGDTGTNMLLTMEAAWREIAEAPEGEVGALLQRVARGALMGARGNSGVILSQIWRGMAQAVDHRPTMGAEDLALALQEATRTAYRGVMKPVEGTILTVIREASEAAAEAAREGGDFVAVLERAVARAREAVRRTPDLLPILKAAGVVDSGGQGLCLILEGMWRYLCGEPVEAEAAVAAAEPVEGPRAAEALEPGAAGYGYDVQFLLVGRNLDVERIRRDLEAMGDSVLVVGDAHTVKVHLHVHDPGRPLSYAVRWGSLRDVVVEDMQAQYEAFLRERERSSGPGPSPRPPGQVAVLAVVPSEGWARLFESLGASGVIHGGPTMNPSTGQFVAALEAAPTEAVIVLPNDPNVRLAAQQAVDLVPGKRVVVLPARTLPQGVAAMVAYRAEADLEDNARSMQEAMGTVRSGGITRATRAVTLEGVSARAGQWIGLVEDRLVAAGDRVEEVVLRTLEAMGAASAELLTIYVGEEADPDQTARLIQAVRSRYPGQQVEGVETGQPYYPYLLSAE